MDGSPSAQVIWAQGTLARVAGAQDIAAQDIDAQDHRPTRGRRPLRMMVERRPPMDFGSRPTI